MNRQAMGFLVLWAIIDRLAGDVVDELGTLRLNMVVRMPGDNVTIAFALGDEASEE